jgi:hypothetical protein
VIKRDQPDEHQLSVTHHQKPRKAVQKLTFLACVREMPNFNMYRLLGKTLANSDQLSSPSPSHMEIDPVLPPVLFSPCSPRGV